MYPDNGYQKLTSFSLVTSMGAAPSAKVWPALVPRGICITTVHDTSLSFSGLVSSHSSLCLITNVLVQQDLWQRVLAPH